MSWHAARDLRRLPMLSEAGRFGAARLPTITCHELFWHTYSIVALTEVTESISHEVVTVFKAWI